uniref:Uncharacterized protein n=1 Tax=Vitis vinifera TaxID=29760 RepID=F6GTB1_VITVI
MEAHESFEKSASTRT